MLQCAGTTFGFFNNALQIVTSNSVKNYAILSASRGLMPHVYVYSAVGTDQVVSLNPTSSGFFSSCFVQNW